MYGTWRCLKLGAFPIKKKLQPFSRSETPAILRYLLIIVVCKVKRVQFLTLVWFL